MVREQLPSTPEPPMTRLLFVALLWTFSTLAPAAEEPRGGPALPFYAKPQAKDDRDTAREDRLVRRFKADIADCRKNVGGMRQDCEREVRSRARTKLRRESAAILQSRSGTPRIEHDPR